MHSDGDIPTTRKLSAFIIHNIKFIIYNAMMFN